MAQASKSKHGPTGEGEEVYAALPCAAAKDS